MKHLYCALAALEACIVLLLSMTIPIDDPETAYNKSETLINFATPVAIYPAVDANPLVKVRGHVTFIRRLRLDQGNGSMKFSATVRRTTSASDSRLKLLCALIC